MNRIIALISAGAAIAIGYMAVSIALGPKGDASGWVLALAFALVAAVFAWRAWRDWVTPDVQPPRPVAPMARQQQPPASDAPGAWRGPDIPIETQIGALKQAGLTLAPGRTIDELLTSWPRAEYESDPYLLLLVMYGSDVEEEPWERNFCERVWNCDMECIVEAGDYTHVFTQILRITGQPQLATQISDDFVLDADATEIRYALNGKPRVLKARNDNDWADPEALAAFMRDIENATGDGRRFWAADNGQASVLVFATDAEAARINALRDELLIRYIAD